MTSNYSILNCDTIATVEKDGFAGLTKRSWHSRTLEIGVGFVEPNTFDWGCLKVLRASCENHLQCPAGCQNRFLYAFRAASPWLTIWQVLPPTILPMLYMGRAKNFWRVFCALPYIYRCQGFQCTLCCPACNVQLVKGMFCLWDVSQALFATIFIFEGGGNRSTRPLTFFVTETFIQYHWRMVETAFTSN